MWTCNDAKWLVFDQKKNSNMIKGETKTPWQITENIYHHNTNIFTLDTYIYYVKG